MKEKKIIFHFSNEFEIYELDDMLTEIVNSKLFLRCLSYEIKEG